MSAMNCDILAPLTANDATYADNTAAGTMSGTMYPGLGSPANSQTTFSDYLQRAQTQSTSTAAGSGEWSNSESSDTTGSQTPTSFSATPQADAGAAERPSSCALRTNRPCGPAMILRPADRIRRRPPRHSAMLRRQRLHQTMATMAARSPAGRRTRTPASRQARPRKTTPTGSKRAAVRPRSSISTWSPARRRTRLWQRMQAALLRAMPRRQRQHHRPPPARNRTTQRRDRLPVASRKRQ